MSRKSNSCLVLLTCLLVFTACSPRQGNPRLVPTLPPTPAQTPNPAAAPSSSPTDIPTPQPIDPAWYQGWWTYTNLENTFSLLLPPDWVVDETTSSNSLMNGHVFMLHVQPLMGNNLVLRVTFRRLGEAVPLWPTGVGDRDFFFTGIIGCCRPTRQPPRPGLSCRAGK